MKKRIALIHNLPSGGAKRALYEYVKRLHKDYSIDLYILSTTNEDFLPLKSFVDNIFIYEYKQPTGIKSSISILTTLRFVNKKIAKDIDSKSYEYVYVTHCQYTQSPYALRYLKTKTIYYLHEPFRLAYEFNIKYYQFPLLKKIRQYSAIRVLKNIDLKNARSADKILSNSYYSYESIYKAYGIISDVCYLGVDTSHFKHFNLKFKNQIIMVGALAQEKGQLYILESIALLKKKERPLVIMVSDRYDEQYHSDILKTAKDLDIKIKILKNISDKKLVELYNESIATICFARVEPFGLTALESFACGTPVIAVKEGGYRETVLNNKNGYLVNRNKKELSNAILKLINNPSERKKFSKYSIEYIKKYWTWDKSYENFKKLIKEE
ncbi:MAG: glycosyltransferase family 4 protein [Patescibacteria group bacterium]